jgi:Regulator of chromosome condensation (RCC1) repeat
VGEAYFSKSTPSQLSQLGNGGTTGNQASPSAVDISALPMGTTSWKSISAGGFHTCAIDNTDKAYCWGQDGNGQLGDGATTTGSNVPSLVSGGLTFQSINTGDRHTCAIGNNDQAYCWGVMPMANWAMVVGWSTNLSQHSSSAPKPFSPFTSLRSGFGWGGGFCLEAGLC